MNSPRARTRTAKTGFLSLNVVGVSAGIAFALLACFSGNAIAIVINNASFEDVVLGPPFLSTNVADVPGWTRSGAAGDAALWRVGYSDSGGNITVAGDGMQFTTLGGGASGLAGSTTWSQTLFGFSIGVAYQLDFMMAAECGPSFFDPACTNQDLTAAIDQIADVSQLFSATNDAGNYWMDWEAKSLNFNADSASVVLSFTANVPYDVGLDHVRITEINAVPAPAPLGLLAFGLVVLGWSHRRGAFAQLNR